jgi:inosose dehydratase
MKDAIAAAGIDLAAICLVEDWLHPEETAVERANADHYISFLQHFPGAMFNLCQMPGKDRENLAGRQRNLLNCVNAIARRAASAGVPCTYHPNSPAGSVFRTAEDYEIMLNGLQPALIGYTPDTGHIARGGMDPLATIKKYRDRVNHVHFKDMDPTGAWAAMGEGAIDHIGVVTYLRDTGFEGWIMVEDECRQAESQPDPCTLNNGRYVRETLVAIS